MVHANEQPLNPDPVGEAVQVLSQAGCLVDPSTKPLLLKETLVPLSRHDLHRCMSAMVGTDTANRCTTRSGYV
jgi:hypothetical protein